MNRSLRSPSQCARPAASSDRGAGPSSTKRPTAAVSCTQTPSAVQQTPWLSQTPDTSRCGWTTAKVGQNVSFPSVCVVKLQQIPPGHFIRIRVPTLFAYCKTLSVRLFVFARAVFDIVATAVFAMMVVLLLPLLLLLVLILFSLNSIRVRAHGWPLLGFFLEFF